LQTEEIAALVRRMHARMFREIVANLRLIWSKAECDNNVDI